MGEVVCVGEGGGGYQWSVTGSKRPLPQLISMAYATPLPLCTSPLPYLPMKLITRNTHTSGCLAYVQEPQPASYSYSLTHICSHEYTHTLTLTKTHTLNDIMWRSLTNQTERVPPLLSVVQSHTHAHAHTNMTS